MADLQISQLPTLAEADLAAGDELAVVDGSASETKRITAKALVERGVALIDAGSIPGSALASLGANTVVTASITDANVTNAKLENSSFSFGGLTVSLGSTDATPAIDLTDATNYPASSLTGTITNAQLAGSIANNKLANSSISLGGVSINLGDTNATPTLDLTNATNYPASSLTGTVSNAQLAGSIANSKLVNSSIAIGGVTLNLGDTDSSPAFDLSDATNYPTSSLSGTITNAQLAGSIQGSKILAASISSTELGANSVTAVELADNSVDTGAVIDSSITDAKISAVSGTKITAGSLPATALNTSNLGTGLAISSNNLVINNTVVAGTAAKVSFSAQGLVTGSASLAASDLPIADATNVGGVSIPAGSGLSVTNAGALSLSNSISATTVSGVSVNSHGLVTGITALVSSDIPTATTSNKGGVIVQSGGGLSVDASGNITTTTSGVAAGTYQSVVVTNKGIITSGSALTDAEIPNISAAKLTSGTIDAARFAANSIGRDKFSDTSTTIFGSVSQSGYPTATYAGEFFFDSVEEDLYIWDSNAWQPVTTLTKGSLKLGGVYNASNSTVSSVTSHGSSVGLTIGQNLPTPSSTTDATYLIVGTGGTPSGIPNGPTGELIPPDYILSVTSSTGSSWVEIDLSTTVSSPTASNVSVISGWGGSSTNVQNALAELSSGKLSLGGGNITGEIKIENSGSFAFEGTANDYETRLTVVDPTSADRTITLPDASGTVVLQGQTGVVDSTMISDGAIMNADINANALISISKLEALTGAQIIIGNSSNEPVAVAVTGDISIDNTGLTAIGAGKIVNSMVSGSAAIAGSKITAASTSASGTVQLNDSTNSTSTSEAATANALKTAYDLANTANTAAAAAFQTTGGTITGDVTIDNAKELRFSEADGDGANYTAFKAQAQSSDITLTLPADSPTGGYVLKANASTPTTLEWAADSATDNTKMPLAGGTFTNDVTFTGDASNGLWDKSQSAFVADLIGGVTGNVVGNVTGNVSGSAATVTGAAQSAITSLGTLTDLDVSSTSTSVIAGTSNTNVLSVRNTTEGNGTVGILMSTQNHASGREKAGIFHVETAGSAHYKGDLVFALNSANGSATQVSTADERMRITSAGKVGIGTTSPGTNLHIQNTSANPQVRISSADNGICELQFGDQADTVRGNILYRNGSAGDALCFNAYNNSEAMRLDSSGRLLVGATADQQGTGALLQVAATAGTAALSANRYTNTADGPSRLYLFKSRATSIGGQTIVQDGDDIGEIVFHASDGTDATQAALIRAEVDGTPGNNDMPGRLSFHTTADGGHTPTERMRIDSSGRVGIGVTSPVDKVNVVGAVRINESSALDHLCNSGTVFEVRGDAIGSGVVDNDFFKGFKLALNDGSEYGGQAQFALGRWEENGTNARSSLMISLGHGGISSASNADVDVLLLKSNGNAEFAGSVTSAGLTVDTNTLHVNATNNQVGIGTTSPNRTLSVRSNGGQFSIIDTDDTKLQMYCNGGVGSIFATGGTNIAGSFKIYTTPSGQGSVQALSINSSQNASFSGTVSDSKGNLRSIPLNNQASAYTLVAADAGKTVSSNGGTITINGGVMASGDAVTLINNSSSDMTIEEGSGSMSIYNTGATDGSSGDRTLAQRGMATIYFFSDTVAYISGAGLS